MQLLFAINFDGGVYSEKYSMPHFHVPETGFLQMYLCLLFFFSVDSSYVLCRRHASYKSPTKVTFLKPLEVVRQEDTGGILSINQRSQTGGILSINQHSQTGGILSINQRSQGDKKNIQFTVPAPFHLSTAISIRKN